jgi:MFS family permease
MKRMLALVTLASMFSTLSVEFIAPFYAVFVGGLGGGLILAGGTWAVYRFGSAIMMWVAGRIEDRWPAEHFVLLGFGLRMLGTTGYFFVTTPWHLLIVQAFQGFGHALIGPGHRKIYSRHLDEGHEAREWSYPEIGHEIATGTAALVGGIVAAQFGFVALFFCMLAAHSVSLCCAYGMWRAAQQERRAQA